MLLVVTCSPSRLTFTGGVVPSVEAMARLRIGVEAVPVAFTRFGIANCWRTPLSELTASDGKRQARGVQNADDLRQ